jgi:hypothetical protein
MFVQHCKGKFTINVGGRWHCGPDHTSPKTLQYDVRVEYPDTALDEHGFLLDNTSFAEYFNRLSYTEDSCELLAKGAAEHFNEACGHKARKIAVDISVPGLADVEYDVEERESV